MNVTQLIGLIEDALMEGLDPETEVVISSEGDWRVLDHTASPTSHEDGYIWFTLFPGDWADSRFTRGHEKCDNDDDVIDERRSRLLDDTL